MNETALDRLKEMIDLANTNLDLSESYAKQILKAVYRCIDDSKKSEDLETQLKHVIDIGQYMGALQYARESLTLQQDFKEQLEYCLTGERRN